MVAKLIVIRLLFEQKDTRILAFEFKNGLPFFVHVTIGLDIPPTEHLSITTSLMFGVVGVTLKSVITGGQYCFQHL